MSEATMTKTPFSHFRVNLVDHDTLKATVSCKVADSLYLTGIKVINGKNGLFMGMPSVKDKQGEYRDIFFPSTKDVRDQLSALVLDQYDKALTAKG